MSDAGPEFLGEIGGTSIYIALTAAPWDLDVDTLLLSIRDGRFGELGEAFVSAFPDIPLSWIDFRAITSNAPQVVDVAAARPHTALRRVVIHSAPDQDMEVDGDQYELDAASTFTAIRAGVQAGGRRIGVRVLSPSLNERMDAARANAMRAVPVLSELNRTGLDAVILFGADLDAVNESRAAWGFVIDRLRTTSDPGGGTGSDFDTRIAMSGTAQRTLNAAWAYAAAARVPISPQLLWFAALENARDSGRKDVAVALLGALTDRSDLPAERLRRLADASGVRRGQSAPMVAIDPRSVPLVRAAVDIAARVNSAHVRHRHLLAAAVLEAEGSAAIARALDWPGDRARVELRAAIAAVLPLEFPDVWDAILLDDVSRAATVTPAPSDGPPNDGPPDDGPPDDVPPDDGPPDDGPPDDVPPDDVPPDGAPPNDAPPNDALDTDLSEDAVPADARIPLTDDSLGLGTYVTMLAAAIAREDTPLPLSIGLFGEWGSGKSYFMGLLRHQIDELAASDNGAYLTGIEQITFNAWHYTDANLWASLGDTIFERLGRKTASVTDRRQVLITEIDTAATRVNSAQERADRARAAQEDAAAALAAERERIATSGDTLLAALTQSRTVRAQADQAWKTLGVADGVAQAELLSAEAGALRSDLFALGRAFRGRRGVLLVAVVFVALVLLGAANATPAGVRHWLTGGGYLALVAVLGTATTLVKRASSAVSTLSAVVAETRTSAREIADRQLGPLQARVFEATRRADELADERDRLVSDVEAKKGELEGLDPSRRWYDFVAERVASQDYQRELGLISTIRRDFEQLIALMKDWRDHPRPADAEHRPINRIVLYIDDLDRCSPRQVMDVLQAVHLILALDLFVVVVGVDPRWLLQSLRRQYRDNFAGAGDDGGSDAGPDATAWAAEPFDYLEKIFNIPFVLPRMTSNSLRSLIDKTSTDSDRRADRAARAAAVVAEGGPATTDATPTEEAATPVTGATTWTPASQSSLASPTAEPPAGDTTTIAPTPEIESEVAAALRGKPAPGIGLTGPERTMLAALGPAVESPREAKRLLNVYRILRSLRSVGSASDFLHRDSGGGDHQALAVLLGVLSVRPSLLGDLLWAPPTAEYPGGLCHRPPTDSWSAVFARLRPRPDPSGIWCNDLGVLSDSAREQWTDVVDKLSEASALVTLADLAPFRVWGPYVARFSFVLSPLAAAIATGDPNLERPTTAPPA